MRLAEVKKVCPQTVVETGSEPGCTVLLPLHTSARPPFYGSKFPLALLPQDGHQNHVLGSPHWMSFSPHPALFSGKTPPLSALCPQPKVPASPSGLPAQALLQPSTFARPSPVATLLSPLLPSLTRLLFLPLLRGPLLALQSQLLPHLSSSSPRGSVKSSPFRAFLRPCLLLLHLPAHPSNVNRAPAVC